MLRAKVSDGMYLFGLDAENVRRLKAGQPIMVDLSDMGGQGKFVLLYGETMAEIVAELEKTTGAKLPPAQPYTKGNA